MAVTWSIVCPILTSADGAAEGALGASDGDGGGGGAVIGGEVAGGGGIVTGCDSVNLNRVPGAIFKSFSVGVTPAFPPFWPLVSWPVRPPASAGAPVAVLFAGVPSREGTVPVITGVLCPSMVIAA